MTTKSLANAIIKRGGKVTLITEKRLKGELKYHDIEMIASNFYTIRSFSKRGYYDQGSDYNPGDYTYLNTIKSIDCFIK